MKIGKRSIKGLVQRLVDVNSYLSVPRFFYVHEKPLQAVMEELFSSGDYPRNLKVNTPIGTASVSLYSVSDFSTLNLVFCRQDYYAPKHIKTVVDIGSNIGLSVMYWLTRDQDCVVYCYEPSEISFVRLQDNTKSFSSRCVYNQVAVSDFAGKATLGIEQSGVYSSLEYQAYAHKTFVNHVECDVVDINSILEEVLSKNSVIDVLKVDSEGHELRTIQAIDSSFWSYISCLNVERCGASPYVPDGFMRSVVSSSERFYRT
jgi:FkbM family methyltransferase